MILMLGTSGAVRVSAPKPVLPESPSIWCYVGPDAWISGAATSGCCNCIDWFIASAYDGKADYAMFDNYAGKINDDTPVFLPFLFGERCPGWDDDRRGGFLRLKPSHSRMDMYRAIQEGTLFNLYHCFEALREVNGTPKMIKLSGGVLNSRIWTRMAADIFNQPLVPDDNPHASVMGSAYLACRVMGVDEDAVAAAVSAASGARAGANAGAGAGMPGSGVVTGAGAGAEATGTGAGATGTGAGMAGSGVVTPDPEAAKLYREKYARYRECYDQTAPRM